MVRVSLPIVLLATSALVAAEPHTSSNPSAHHLTARDTALSSANHLEARTFLFGNHGVLSWLLGQQKRCPLTFRANGSGKDGYQYDIYGNSCPSHFPRGWLYFGVWVIRGARLISRADSHTTSQSNWLGAPSRLVAHVDQLGALGICECRPEGMHLVG